MLVSGSVNPEPWALVALRIQLLTEKPSQLALPFLHGGACRNPRDPCTQILPALGPKVCKYYLHWAIWIPRGILVPLVPEFFIVHILPGAIV